MAAAAAVVQGSAPTSVPQPPTNTITLNYTLIPYALLTRKKALKQLVKKLKRGDRDRHRSTSITTKATARRCTRPRVRWD